MYKNTKVSINRETHRNKKRSIGATSEVIGAALLLLLAVSSSTIIYHYVLGVDFFEEETHVSLTGYIQDGNLIIEHTGGEPIDLNSRILISLGAKEINLPVKEQVYDENQNGYWNMGEKLIYPLFEEFSYNLDTLVDFQGISTAVVDDKTNSFIFYGGQIEVMVRSDAAVTAEVSNLRPNIGDDIIIWINVTSYGGDINGSGAVKVRCMFPEELLYNMSTSPTGHGSYDFETGLWDVGNVFVGSPATLEIYATVLDIGSGSRTQLSFIADSSSSTHPSTWEQIKEGVNKALDDENAVPRNGIIEFSFIKYGGGQDSDAPRAIADLEPTLITPYTYDELLKRNSAHMKGRTPMCCGIRLAADLINESENYEPIIVKHSEGSSYGPVNYTYTIRRIILLTLSTLGDPDCEWINGSYTASPTNPVNHTLGRSSAEQAIEYLKSILDFQETKDEINVIVISKDKEQIDEVELIPWLNSSIAWPNPSIWDYTTSVLPSDPGWVTFIDVQKPHDVADRIHLIFQNLLSGVELGVEIIDSTTFDPSSHNDYATIILQPQLIY